MQFFYNDDEIITTDSIHFHYSQKNKTKKKIEKTTQRVLLIFIL